MRCDQAREALSARLDDELPADEAPLLEDHLRGCGACRAWEDQVADASRRALLHAALPPGRDLAPAVLAGSRSQQPSVPWGAERVLLVLVGAVMLLAALPVLLGSSSVHLLREAGVTDVALAVGVLVAAVQPWRAAGMLPVVVVLAAGLTVTSGADVLAGRVSLVAESLHVLAPTAALLLWRLRRQVPAPAPVPGPRLSVVDRRRDTA